MGCSPALVQWFLGEVESLEAHRVWRDALRVRREARRVRRETKRLRRELRREQRRQREADLLAWNALMEPFEG